MNHYYNKSINIETVHLPYAKDCVCKNKEKYQNIKRVHDLKFSKEEKSGDISNCDTRYNRIYVIRAMMLKAVHKILQ